MCFLVYVLGFITVACELAFDRKSINWMIDQAERFWDDPDDYPNVALNIEKAFKCRCWDNATCLSGETIEGESCEAKLKRGYDEHRWTAVGIVSGACALMIAGAICAFAFACRIGRHDDSGRAISYSRIDPDTAAW
jgi:hypothetical protein